MFSVYEKQFYFFRKGFASLLLNNIILKMSKCVFVKYAINFS